MVKASAPVCICVQEDLGEQGVLIGGGRLIGRGSQSSAEGKKYRRRDHDFRAVQVVGGSREPWRDVARSWEGLRIAGVEWALLRRAAPRAAGETRFRMNCQR